MNLDNLSDEELTTLYHKEKMNSLDSLTDEQLMALHKEEKERIAHSWDGPKKGARHIEGSPRHQAENEASARIARDVPITAGSVVDLAALPVYGARKAYDAITGTKRKETPYFAEDAANMFDKATDNVAAPTTTSQRFMSNIRQGMLGVPFTGPLGKVAQVASKAIPAERAIRTSNALAKTGNFLREGSKLNPANLGGAAGASVLGSLAAETGVPYLPVAASLVGGILGGSVANGSAQRTLAPWSLPQKQRDALRVTKDFKKAQKWATRLAIDLKKLKRDQELGIHGTLATYSGKGYLKTHELGQRRHPMAEKFYKDIDIQNIERYKEILGMDHPIFEQLNEALGGDILQKGAHAHAEHIKPPEWHPVPDEQLQQRLGLSNPEIQAVEPETAGELIQKGARSHAEKNKRAEPAEWHPTPEEEHQRRLGLNNPEVQALEPASGGELLQKGADARKEERETAIGKLYDDVRANSPEDAVIPAENLQHIGSHVREDLKGLSAKERKARIKESHSIPYIERLTPNIHENPDFIPDTLSSMGTPKPIVESIRKLPIDQQMELVEKLGIKLEPHESNLMVTQDVPLKSFQSTKKSLREDAKKNLGLITNAEHGSQKHLFQQMNEAETAYLKEHHPDLYEAKKLADAEHADFKRKEAYVLNEFLGPSYKPTTPESAHATFSSKVAKDPNYLDVPSHSLNNQEKSLLAYSFLKSRARKNQQGQITAKAFSEAYLKLSPKLQKKLKNYLPAHIRDSIDTNAKFVVSEKAPKAPIHVPTEQEMIVESLLSRPGKPVSPQSAHAKVTQEVKNNPKYLDIPASQLTRQEKQQLAYSILKSKATKNAQGQITAEAFSKAYLKLSPAMQKQIKQYLPKHIRNSIDKNAKLAVSQKAPVHLPTAEEILVGNLLSKPGKHVTPEQAFKKATVGANTDIRNVSLAQQHLSPEDTKLLNLSILKDRATKSMDGRTTASSFAQGFSKLSPKEQATYLSHLKGPNQELFREAVESILSKKGLEAFENTSGSTHHAQHLGFVGRGAASATAAVFGEIRPLLGFLASDVALPYLSAKKLFTNQDFLKKINMLNHAKDHRKALRIGELIMKNTSFKEALTKSVIRMKLPESNKENEKTK